MTKLDQGVIDNLCSSVMLNVKSERADNLFNDLYDMTKWIEKIASVDCKSINDSDENINYLTADDVVTSSDENSKIKARYLNNEIHSEDYFVVPKVINEDE